MRQTEYVILGLLSEAPLTGYQIKRIIDIRFRFFWDESYGQLYPTLKTLHEEGLIEEIGLEQVQKRAQKTYRLTSVGFAALKVWLAQPVEKESVRLEILLKMYFSHLVDASVMVEHLMKFKKAHEQDLVILDQFEKELQSIPEQHPDHTTVLRVIDFGQKMNRAYLDWSRETITFLEGRKNK